MPMLKTIKSEVEEDDDFEDYNDEATIDMQFDQERAPQKSN